MKTQWEILEISPTAEISIIKKAYAKKLKVTRPEDNPEGFQLLREAYGSALQYAKFHQYVQEATEQENIEHEGTEQEVDDFVEGSKKESYDNLEDIESYENNEYDHQEKNEYIENGKDIEYYKDIEYEFETLDFPYYHLTNSRVDFTEVDEEHGKLIEEFFEKIHILYHDFFNRIKDKNWQELLNDELLWKLDFNEMINWRLLHFLTEHRFLPRTVWKILDDTFHWGEQEIFLDEKFSEEFVQYLLLQLSDEIVPRYCYFDKNYNINYDEYLSYREKAFMALRECDIEKAINYISQAYEIFPKDPELICMKGVCYYKVGETKNFIKAFRSANDINPNDMTIDLFQANIMFENREYPYALKICDSILSQVHDIFEVEILKGKCLFYMKKWHKAGKVFIRILNNNHSDMQSKKYLIKIAEEMRDILKQNPLNFIMRKDLKEIYIVLDEIYKIREIRIKFKDIITIIKKFLKFCIIVICIIVGILLIFSGSGIIIAIIIAFVRSVRKNEN